MTFPRNKAEESPFQQHDLSILIVGPNQLKHRLSRTDKPKSRHKTNTFCPLTHVLSFNPLSAWGGIAVGGGLELRPVGAPGRLGWRGRAYEKPTT